MRPRPIGQPVVEGQEQPDPANYTDEEALRAAGLKDGDVENLTKYLRQWTGTADRASVQSLIAKFGSEDFDERLKAAKQIVKIGPPAIPILLEVVKHAKNEKDPEISFQCSECLRKMEKVPYSVVTSAVVRSLAKSESPQIVKTLLDFVPSADSPEIVELIRATLTALTARTGKPDPALLEALQNSELSRRTLAALVLIEAGRKFDQGRLPEVYPKILAAAKAETDPGAKFEIFFALMNTSKESEAVLPLISLFSEVARGRQWQLEDALSQLAGDAAPKDGIGQGGGEGINRAKEAWKTWWEKDAKSKIPESFVYKPRTTGQLFLVSNDPRAVNSHQVSLLGADMKEKWSMKPGTTISSAVPTGPASTMVAEMNAPPFLFLRDLKGQLLPQGNLKKLNAENLVQPAQRLHLMENGNILAVFGHKIVELSKEKHDIVWKYQRPNTYDVRDAVRMPDGRTFVLLQNQPACIMLDKKGEEIKDFKLDIQQPSWNPSVEVVSDDRILVTHQGSIAEYNLKTGKQVWSHRCQQPQGAQRLFNGNTLVLSQENNQMGPTSFIAEVTPKGGVVWTYRLPQHYIVGFRVQ